MTIKDFGELLAGNNGVRISKDLVIYEDFELYNYKTEESKCYNSLEELVNDNADVKAIIESTEAFALDWSGGRGAGSSSGMGGGFGHASGGGGAGDKDVKKLHPAELNLGNAKGASVDQTVEKFEAKYGDAKIEYGVTIDEQGFATSSSKTTKGRYTITKTDKFKAKEFDKAISKAKWPTHMDYNTGASWWLKKNAKTYGYIFTQKGVVIGDEWKPKK